MAVPKEIRAVKRPVNTIVVDRGGNGFYRYAVIERIGCVRKNGSNQPVSGGTIGHIVDGKFVACEKIPLSMSYVELKDYANVVLIDMLSSDLLDELEKVYELKDARRIYVMAILKVVYPNEAYKRMELRYENSFLSEMYPSLPLSKNTITEFLKKLGGAYSRISEFMKNRVETLEEGHKLIIDGTLKTDNSYVNTLSHFSRKARIKGTKDITVLYAYDGDEYEPVCSKVYAGNVLDSVAFENFLTEMNIRSGIVLADKGFPHSKAAKVFKDNENLHYLLPIKRGDSRYEKYKLDEYEERYRFSSKYILAKKVEVKAGGKNAYWLYSFSDRSRASKEEGDYLKRGDKNGEEFSNEELEEKRKDFGTIVFESDLDAPADVVYRMYENRWFIEECFHYYKDEDEFTVTRVHDDCSVIGSEFISFLSTLMTARLFKRFDSLELFKDNSYKDIMTDLAQAKKVRAAKDGEWLFVQLPAGIQDELRKFKLMPDESEEKPKRGRPRKKVVDVGPKRKPGRPKGSKNKPKS